jgi:hypothetical protein
MTKQVIKYNIVAKMAKENPSLMVAMVNFELLCDVNLLISFILFIAYARNNPCTNQICAKVRCFFFV